MSHRLSATLLIAATVVTLTATSACSSSGSGAAGPTAPVSSPAGVGNPVPGAGSNSAADIDQGPPTGGDRGAGPGNSGITPAGGSGQATCAQLTKAQMQPLSADPIVSVSVQAVGSNSDGQTCDFDSNDGEGVVDVMVIPLSDPMVGGFDHEVTAELDKPVALPGIGAAAFGDDSAGEVVAQAGGILCEASAGGDTVPGEGKLEQAAGATVNIGAAAYRIINTALGKGVCNRVFGSGDTTIDLSGLATVTVPSPTS